MKVECPVCGTVVDETELRECPWCGSMKCELCDNGDDVECGNCENGGCARCANCALG